MDILSYKPQLEYEKEILTNINEYTIPDIEQKLKKYSTTPYSRMIVNPISDVILAIENTLKTTTEYLEALKKSLEDVKADGISFQSYTNALNEGNNELSDKYVEANASSISGNTGVEVYSKIYDFYVEVQGLRTLIGTLMYGSGTITYLEAQQIEKMKLAKILEYEQNYQNQKINYTALVSDGFISIALATYMDNLASSIDAMYNVVAEETDMNSINYSSESSVGLFNEFFGDSYIICKDADSRLKAVKDSNAIEESIKKTFVLRRRLMDITNAKADLSSNNDVIVNTIFGTKLDNAINAMFSRVLDFNKESQRSYMYRSDYMKALQQKADIRRVYASLK